MSRPTVAIIGRPNVGKSTLFNRLLGGRPAIVSAEAGTTRDRHFGSGEWAGRSFWLVDTGGLVPDSNDSMDRAIRKQVEAALEQSDAIVLVVDGQAGLHPIDAAIAELLRRSGRPVLVAVNKLDDLPNTTAEHEFHSLGLGEPIGISAAVGKASGDLLDAIVARFPEKDPEEDEETVGVAIIGRPNVGKSSITNRLIGEERVVVSPVAGTTRDAIDTPLRYHGRTIIFIDTAGLRRKSQVHDDIEFYSTIRTEQAVDRAEVCVLVVDAALGVQNQDLRIATQAWDRGCALIIAVNKWDLIEEKDANTAERGQQLLTEKAPFLKYVPFLYVSAESGLRIHKLLDLILEVAEARKQRIQTAEVNRVLKGLLERNGPPQQGGDEVKLLYASQIGTAPPTFAIVSNRPADVPEAYQRYLIHGFRAAWPFSGSPMRLKLTRRGDRR
jgi:GTP-binding protein